MKTSNILENKTPSDTLNSAAGTCESSSSTLFKTTTRIKSGTYAFAKSRLVMTFLAILRVT